MTTPSKPTETVEQEARRLRDLLFGKPTTDENWNWCKEKWIEDIEWLRQHAIEEAKERKNE